MMGERRQLQASLSTATEQNSDLDGNEFSPRAQILLRKELGLRRFHSAQNTPETPLLKRLVNVPKGALMRRLVMLKGGR